MSQLQGMGADVVTTEQDLKADLGEACKMQRGWRGWALRVVSASNCACVFDTQTDKTGWGCMARGPGETAGTLPVPI